jgi:hypothetical protein
VLIFVVKLPQADAFLALLATLGVVAAVEGLYLLLVASRPAVVLDGDGISVRSRVPFGRTRRIEWRELRGGQSVRRQFIELTTTKRPFRIWSEFVAGGRWRCSRRSTRWTCTGRASTRRRPPASGSSSGRVMVPRLIDSPREPWKDGIDD